MIEIDVLVKIACGYEHTLVLTDKGEIYDWGNNSNGQVGVNNKLQPSLPIVVTHRLLMKNFLIIVMMNESRNRIIKNDRQSTGERAQDGKGVGHRCQRLLECCCRL